MSMRDELRIGDAEREQTMAALREHFAQGRLTHEELDERLDQTLSAKTARDLAQVTADLPGPGQALGPAYDDPGYARHPGHPGAIPHFDRGDWRAAMAAHRRQMQSIHHAQRDMHRAVWSERHGRPWRGRRGPSPLVPVLFVVTILALIFGGFGAFKVLFFVWLAALCFSGLRRRFHHRG
ncbi:DUF1707 domain-containing protein [Nonomuraea sp. K274]|uniref:DUF1707 domain-containing protein n=1 Tax=Nonomuraea cypriaca TaxID=1187855 RepID=A0A931F040_9ACTN|nr:DUF1707 domain-containing protein [Nonomuraea cypriaca]MBF8190489.1 DUF1707 domain-containing protein [Nonomuraea cypriaca]